MTAYLIEINIGNRHVERFVEVAIVRGNKKSAQQFAKQKAEQYHGSGTVEFASGTEQIAFINSCVGDFAAARCTSLSPID